MDTVALFAAAAGVAWWQVTVVALAGLVIGGGSAWLAVTLESREKLEEEEQEERAEYEAECAKAAATAREKNEAAPKIVPWKMERYGWTWIERVLVPLLTAALFGAFTFHQGWNRELVLHLLWIAILVHIIGFDLKHRLILNVITYPSIVLSIALAPLTPGLNLGGALFGALLLGLFFYLPALFIKGSVGMGDAKLAIMVGATTGLDFTSPYGMKALYAAVYGVLLGGLVSILLLATRIARLRDPIPYGPFICAGAIIVLYGIPTSPL